MTFLILCGLVVVSVGVGYVIGWHGGREAGRVEESARVDRWLRRHPEMYGRGA